MPTLKFIRPRLVSAFASWAILFALLFAGVSNAADLTNATPLRVGVSPVFPPMVFKQGKELAGVEVDLARALSEHLGRKVEFVEVPWADQIESLNARKTDIIMSCMSVTPARKSVVAFSQPYFLIGQMPLVRRAEQNNLAFDLSPGFKGSIGTLRATTGEYLVQRDFPKANAKSYKTSEDAVKALTRKKIDVFISDSPVVWYLAGTHASEGLSVLPAALSEEKLAWAVRKDNPALLKSVNEFIEQKSSKDGQIRQIFRRWMAVGE